MKDNEIGHFAYDKPRFKSNKTNQYPRQRIAKDSKGNILFTEGEQIKWLSNWESLGEVDTIDSIEGIPFTELLIDLQTAQDCYCADLLVVNGVEYVCLTGSGWAGVGFPFWDEIFDPEHPYITGRGCYAILRGEAKDKFIALARKDYIPDFKKVSTGNHREDFILPK